MTLNSRKIYSLSHQNLEITTFDTVKNIFGTLLGKDHYINILKNISFVTFWKNYFHLKIPLDFIQNWLTDFYLQ